jgi:predicted enzyme related to lactoylglutathione lyase
VKIRTAIALMTLLGFAGGMAFESARAKTTSPAASRVTGIGGVFFKARDPQKLAAWYRENLGIDQPADTNGGGAPPNHGFEWREKDHSEKIGITDWAVFPARTKYFGTGPQPFMIDYRVDNLDGVLAQLRAAGATVEPKIETGPNGRFAWAADPEGNRFELWEPKP